MGKRKLAAENDSDEEIDDEGESEEEHDDEAESGESEEENEEGDEEGEEDAAAASSGEEEEEEEEEENHEDDGEDEAEENDDFTIDAEIKDPIPVKKSFLQVAAGFFSLGPAQEHQKLIVENLSGKFLTLVVGHDPNQTTTLEVKVGLKMTSGVGGSRREVFQRMPGDQSIPIKVGTIQKPSTKGINWSGDQMWVTVCNFDGSRPVGPKHLLIKKGQRLVLTLQ
jgi:hypothetical protein